MNTTDNHNPGWPELGLNVDPFSDYANTHPVPPVGIKMSTLNSVIIGQIKWDQKNEEPDPPSSKVIREGI